MKQVFGGPLFESADSGVFRSSFGREGAHYNIFHVEPDDGMDALRCIFPDGRANELNFVLFSTSGVHGSYVTIEDIERGLRTYGGEPEGDEWPDDWHGDCLTFVIVQPRTVTMRYGNARVTLEDIDYLKRLRSSSWSAIGEIGRDE